MEPMEDHDRPQHEDPPVTGDPEIDDILRDFQGATAAPATGTQSVAAAADAHRRLHARLSSPT